jgi:hypothetical protein
MVPSHNKTYNNLLSSILASTMVPSPNRPHNNLLSSILASTNIDLDKRNKINKKLSKKKE